MAEFYSGLSVTITPIHWWIIAPVFSKYLVSQLGNKSDLLRYEIDDARYRQFAQYSPIIRRTLRDKPDGWEHTLSAALLRELNQPIFDRLADLREGTLFKLTSAVTEDNLLQWFREQISPMEHMVPAIMKCLEKLQVGWGEVGVSGNENTIHSACLLLAENLSEIVKLEERLCFSILPEEAEKLRDLMQNQAEGAIAELQRLPDELDQFVINAIEAEINGVDGSKELAITFELNDSWSDEVNRLFES